MADIVLSFQKMFLQMNKKLGETLLHFLFMNIDCERAAKVFRDCWPIVERKQEMIFHKGTFEWYKSLQQVRMFSNTQWLG